MRFGVWCVDGMWGVVICGGREDGESGCRGMLGVVVDGGIVRG